MYILSTPSPVWSENEILETTRKRMKWENEDYICRGHILNGMSDSLFDIYQNAESAKVLWESLESKYMAEDASATKFLDDEVAWWVDSGATIHVCKDLRCPVWSENEILETTRKRMKWENEDYICRGHILNGMSDSLFDIYQNAESAKALWESLESKYMAEDASATKFLVSSFMNYKMIDNRHVMEQYHEMLRNLGQYT
nr:zinc finger, CCHC-type [Tanacetum cinerariifolium]